MINRQRRRAENILRCLSKRSIIKIVNLENDIIGNLQLSDAMNINQIDSIAFKIFVNELISVRSDLIEHDLKVDRVATQNFQIFYN